MLTGTIYNFSLVMSAPALSCCLFCVVCFPASRPAAVPVRSYKRRRILDKFGSRLRAEKIEENLDLFLVVLKIILNDAFCCPLSAQYRTIS